MEDMTLKAYSVFSGRCPSEMGCLLVWAETVNKAKLHGWHKLPWEPGPDYIDMRARRVKAWDWCAAHVKEAKGDRAFEVFSISSNRELPEGSEKFYLEGGEDYDKDEECYF